MGFIVTMNDTGKTIICVVGMVCVTTLLGIALYCGIDGVALSAGIAAISAMVGVAFGVKLKESQTKGGVSE